MASTTSSTITSPRRAVGARLRAPLLVAATLVCGLAVAPSATVEAAPRTSSEVVAAEAGRAVAALDRWELTQSPVDFVRFVRSRDRAAELTAAELQLDVRGLQAAWADAPDVKQHAVLAAMSQLGVPYEYLGSEPGVGFDCSGLTGWAFGDAGIELPRVSGDQIDAAERIERDEIEPGDLVYYPGHIGIYVGADYYVHSPNSGNDVVVGPLPGRSLQFGDAVVSPADAP